MDIWKPHVTVAAVIEQDGRFLLVEELVGGKRCLNQPAGHWESNETLTEAVSRETREETAYDFEAEFLIGIYRWANADGKVYLRFAFGGRIFGHDPSQPLNEPIIATSWYKAEEIRAAGARHRTPMVQKCVDDYLANKRYPLALLTEFM